MRSIKLDKRTKPYRLLKRLWSYRYYYTGAVLMGIVLGVAIFVLAVSIKREVNRPLLNPRSENVGVGSLRPQTVYAQENKEKTPIEPLKYIRTKGQQLGYDDYTISRFIRVARCESNLRPTAKNGSSTAAGVYQILIGTWEGNDCYGSRYNAQDNIDCAYKIFQKRGFQPWNASKHCWNKS